MITHTCVPNSGHFENMNDGTLEVVSLIDIPKNAPITMCYDWCLKVGEVFQRFMVSQTTDDVMLFALF